MSNGPLPPGPVEQIMTLLVPELARIDRNQVNYGLILERSLEGYWMLSAQTIFGVLAVDVVPMILNFDAFQRVKSLKAGANITLWDADGVVEIAAADAQKISARCRPT